MHYDAKRSDEIHAVLARALRRLGPRMARSLEANRLLAGKEATRQMRPMIDRFRDAAIAVDRTGRIVAANAMAETLLFETGILRTGPRNMLHFVAADAERTFRQHLAAILGATIAACSLCEDMRIVQDSRMHVVSLLAVGSGLDRRSYGSFLPIHYDETLCLLIIRETTILVSARESSLEGLDRYKLTRSEARVVMALCEGGSMREIAARLDIAYETLRTHLKRIYEKTGLEANAILCVSSSGWHEARRTSSVDEAHTKLPCLVLVFLPGTLPPRTEDAHGCIGSSGSDR